jgi:hypothetical protein
MARFTEEERKRINMTMETLELLCWVNRKLNSFTDEELEGTSRYQKLFKILRERARSSRAGSGQTSHTPTQGTEVHDVDIDEFDLENATSETAREYLNRIKPKFASAPKTWKLINDLFSEIFSNWEDVENLMTRALNI